MTLKVQICVGFFLFCQWLFWIFNSNIVIVVLGKFELRLCFIYDCYCMEMHAPLLGEPVSKGSHVSSFGNLFFLLFFISSALLIRPRLYSVTIYDTIILTISLSLSLSFQCRLSLLFFAIFLSLFFIHIPDSFNHFCTYILIQFFLCTLINPFLQTQKQFFFLSFFKRLDNPFFVPEDNHFFYISIQIFVTRIFDNIRQKKKNFFVLK